MALAAFLLITLLGACAAEPTPTPTPTPRPQVDIHVSAEEPFVLGLGDSAFLFANDHPYRLDFDGVVGDSRCPVGSECLRPDVAILEFTLTDFDSSEEPVAQQLFFDSGQSSAPIGPFSIQILSLLPRVEDVDSPDLYRVTLLSNVTPENPSPVELDIAMTASTQTAAVGDRVAYTASAAGAGRAQYSLLLNQAVVGILRYDGKLARGPQTSVIDLVEWEVDEHGARWVITPLVEGEFVVDIVVRGAIEVSTTAENRFIAGKRAGTLTVE
jgi:hypothetical protein